MINTKGRPKGTKIKKQINIDIDKFRKEVLSGQSISMIAYKFKINKKNVIDLCKQESLPCNTAGLLNFVTKLKKYS